MRYFENLDDFQDGSRPPIMDWVEWLVSRLIAIGAIMLIFIICGTLEVL